MLDNKYDFKVKELQWMNYWETNKIFKFQNDERELYSIDTPPPTVSGNIHTGHVFSYSQQEIIARYKRLRNYNVFYPFGFDNNGLPTERLVEKILGKKAQEFDRKEFRKKCLEVVSEYEFKYKSLFQRLGFSVDWDLSYSTISNESVKISQLSFLDLYNKNKIYQKESPSLWCTECLTSIAQAELETKTNETYFNHIKFKTTDNIEFVIATTRVELLPAIVAIFINPKDSNNKHLINKTAIVPLLNIEVPILSDEKVDKEKGSGIVMCCTFGDVMDIEWWNKYNLPLKNILTKDGNILYKGVNRNVKDTRTEIFEELKSNGYIIKSEKIEHEVQTHERCGTEIEYLITQQWYIDLMNHKSDFLKIGKDINWYPKSMHNRYKEWVENVMWDWCISRQRFFGVPIPVWKCANCNKIHVAEEKNLPVDPTIDNLNKTCSCGSTEFIGEKDIMDTWATSSITPLINMKYKQDNNFEKILNPMSLRHHAHDIIRTWDFYTIVKSFYHFNDKPWKNIMISGFVLASKGEKISKSKSNEIKKPEELIDLYGTDVIRYWAGTGKIGMDVVYSEETLLRGRKLINKLYNVSKFIEMHLTDFEDKEFEDYEYFDEYILNKYSKMETQFLKYLDNYEIGLGLNLLEKFFWNFCDNYIEIVKHRLYRPEEFKETAKYSGQKTIRLVLYKLLQKFSIYFPFVTEEIYQSIYGKQQSIHTTIIKKINYEFENSGDQIIDIISAIRGEKTNNNVSLRTKILNIELQMNEKLHNEINKCYDDFIQTLTIENLKITNNSEFKIINIELEQTNV